MSETNEESPAVAAPEEVAAPVADDRLSALRAQLSEAEQAVADVAEDADASVKNAAEKARVAAEKALAKAHVVEQAAAAKVEQEVRVVEKSVKALTTQEANAAASTQNVRGTDALSVEEHAKRLNPTP